MRTSGHTRLRRQPGVRPALSRVRDVIFLGWPRTLQSRQYAEHAVLNRNILGGVGGRFQMRKTAGAAAVSTIPRTKIYADGVSVSGEIARGHGGGGVLTACFGPLVSGAITCAKAAPIGFMMAMAIVAVVLPRTLNHNSLYFVGSTWKTACEMLATNF